MGKRRKLARLLAGTCLLVGSAGMARAEVRSLSLYNTHTQERASIVFKRDGVYDQNGLNELNRLLRDWRRNEVTRMDPGLFDLVWEVYRDSGSHQPIHIVSGYRSPTTNNALRSRSRGVAKFSQHMLGKAMDFYLPDVNLSFLREVGMKKQVGGVGFYPTSGSPFVHMDTGSVRAWPRMTREQLVRLFPNGKTAHLPADGNPLPGYQQALAEVEARKAHGGATTSTSSSGGGLLAALFGGGSSSSSSYAASSDEDEEGATRAPRRTQELRQGPIAARTQVARAEETPPGVESSVPVYHSKPMQPQVRLAEPALPQPAPPRDEPPRLAAAVVPGPTATARGSLVALPVSTPLPQPAPMRMASAGQPIPSRYGPSGHEIPPGWVQGPSGRPARMETEQLAALAAEPVRGTPIAVPLPPMRPGSATAGEMVAMATAHGTPIAVAVPRPRPGGPMRTAAFEGSSADAARALAALTGEAEDPMSALGYASAAAPGPASFVTASIPSTSRSQPAQQTAVAAPDGRNPADIVSRFAAPSPATAAAVARAAARAAKADRVAAAQPMLVAGKSDRASELRLLDAAEGVADAGFAQLRHPDQQSLASVVAEPATRLAVTFDHGASDELVDRRFTGPAIVALAVLQGE